MSVFGKLMDSMRINSDPEDDEYYDEEEDYDDAPRGSIFKRNKVQEDDYYDDEETPKKSIFGSTRNNVQAAPVRKQMEVSMIKPTSVEDARTITDCLLSGKAVVLNMEGIATELAQRIIDFTSGAAYSMDGKLQRISNYIFIATPSQVELSGDFQDLLNSGQFDISGVSMRL